MSETNADDKNLAVVTHLGGTIFSVIPSLAVWLIKKDSNEYVAGQAKEALNFQITVLIAWMACSVLAWILIGFALMPLLWLGNIVFCIVAAVKTSQDGSYRYPLTLRLIT